jgi:hypothetical protein
MERLMRYSNRIARLILRIFFRCRTDIIRPCPCCGCTETRLRYAWREI